MLTSDFILKKIIKLVLAIKPFEEREKRGSLHVEEMRIGRNLFPFFVTSHSDKSDFAKIFSKIPTFLPMSPPFYLSISVFLAFLGLRLLMPRCKFFVSQCTLFTVCLTFIYLKLVLHEFVYNYGLFGVSDQRLCLQKVLTLSVWLQSCTLCCSLVKFHG